MLANFSEISSSTGPTSVAWLCHSEGLASTVCYSCNSLFQIKFLCVEGSQGACVASGNVSPFSAGLALNTVGNSFAAASRPAQVLFSSNAVDFIKSFLVPSDSTVELFNLIS